MRQWLSGAARTRRLMNRRSMRSCRLWRVGCVKPRSREPGRLRTGSAGTIGGWTRSHAHACSACGPGRRWQVRLSVRGRQGHSSAAGERAANRIVSDQRFDHWLVTERRIRQGDASAHPRRYGRQSSPQGCCMVSHRTGRSGCRYGHNPTVGHARICRNEGVPFARSYEPELAQRP
jgi:hypothetical protein